ncbi:hypothetical protein AMEX_G2238 [Astyanax mexicanus]|uniref:Chemokine interleukin-8-like domain-containing protein n=1 Tax=Astyanax mexicanus TaxID=7994 RepID=A0A8T2MJY4_ASTMX|nr:hypothetical protein AMEX_G2238 [Astyanax mexicanus]
MRFSLTFHQMACIFFITVFLSSCVLGVFSNDTKKKTCCPRVSKAALHSQIEMCARVSGRKNIFGKTLCHEAYLFITKNGKKHCIDVNARWINEILEQLKEDGNPCKGTTN